MGQIEKFVDLVKAKKKPQKMKKRVKVTRGGKTFYRMQEVNVEEVTPNPITTSKFEGAEKAVKDMKVGEGFSVGSIHVSRNDGTSQFVKEYVVERPGLSKDFKTAAGAQRYVDKLKKLGYGPKEDISAEDKKKILSSGPTVGGELDKLARDADRSKTGRASRKILGVTVVCDSTQGLVWVRETDSSGTTTREVTLGTDREIAGNIARNLVQYVASRSAMDKPKSGTPDALAKMSDKELHSELRDIRPYSTGMVGGVTVVRGGRHGSLYSIDPGKYMPRMDMIKELKKRAPKSGTLGVKQSRKKKAQTLKVSVKKKKAAAKAKPKYDYSAMAEDPTYKTAKDPEAREVKRRAAAKSGTENKAKKGKSGTAGAIKVGDKISFTRYGETISGKVTKLGSTGKQLHVTVGGQVYNLMSHVKVKFMKSDDPTPIIGDKPDLADFLKANASASIKGWAKKMKAEGGDHPFTWCKSKVDNLGFSSDSAAFCAAVHLEAYGMTPSQRKKAKEKK